VCPVQDVVVVLVPRLARWWQRRMDEGKDVTHNPGSDAPLFELLSHHKLCSNGNL